MVGSFDCSCVDDLSFSSVSEDDLGDVEPDLSVDEVSSSSEDIASSSSDNNMSDEESAESIHDWGTKKSNYYGGQQDVGRG